MNDRPSLTPLRMAQNAAANVLAYADAQESDPVQAHISGTGRAGMNTAIVAGNMALVSIAESLARIASLLEVEALGGRPRDRQRR